MNTPKPSKMPYFILGAVVLLSLLAYFYIEGSVPQDSATLDQVNATEQVGNEVYRLLAEIKAIKIDTAFFQSPLYLTLRDYTVNVPALPVGRSNPFAPVPGVSLPSGSAANQR